MGRSRRKGQKPGHRLIAAWRTSGIKRVLSRLARVRIPPIVTAIVSVTGAVVSVIVSLHLVQKEIDSNSQLVNAQLDQNSRAVETQLAAESSLAEAQLRADAYVQYFQALDSYTASLSSTSQDVAVQQKRLDAWTATKLAVEFVASDEMLKYTQVLDGLAAAAARPGRGKSEIDDLIQGASLIRNWAPCDRDTTGPLDCDERHELVEQTVMVGAIG